MVFLVFAYLCSIILVCNPSTYPTPPPTPPHTWTHDDPRRQDTDDDGARDVVRIHAEPGLEDLPVEDPELVVDLVEDLNRAVPAGPDLVVDLNEDGVFSSLLLIFLFALVLGLCGCHGGCRQAESTQSVVYIRELVRWMCVGARRLRVLSARVSMWVHVRARGSQWSPRPSVPPPS